MGSWLLAKLGIRSVPWFGVEVGGAKKPLARSQENGGLVGHWNCLERGVRGHGRGAIGAADGGGGDEGPPGVWQVHGGARHRRSAPLPAPGQGRRQGLHAAPRARGMLNELSYAVLWRVAERQARLGLSVVVDSPLSRRAHLDALTRLPAALVIVVECRPGNEEEWRRRLEGRGAAVADGGGDGWHKPNTWAELETLVEGYQGCTDYDIGDVPRIVVDTTDPMVDAEAIAVRVVDFIRSLLVCAH